METQKRADSWDKEQRFEGENVKGNLDDMSTLLSKSYNACVIDDLVSEPCLRRLRDLLDQ